MHKKVICCFVIFTHMSLFCMDVWTIIVAASDTKTKNTFRSVCTTLQTISSRNNCQLYLCNNLVLTELQKGYALGLAIYKNLTAVIDNLCDNHGANKNEEWFNQPVINLALYNNVIKQKHTFPTTPPHYLVAATLGDLDYLQSYCSNPENEITAITINDLNILMLATYYGHSEIVKLLLTHSSINNIIKAKNSYGYTSLRLAAHCGSLDIVTLLHNYYPNNLNNQDAEGATPLYVAVKNNHVSTIEFFLEQKTVNTSLGPKNYTPLHVSAEKGYLKIIKLLLKHSPDLINHHDNIDTTTALHLAAGYQQFSAVKTLLKTKNIDVNIVSKLNKTPLDYALEKNNSKIISLLQKHGAKTAQELSKNQELSENDECIIS